MFHIQKHINHVKQLQHSKTSHHAIYSENGVWSGGGHWHMHSVNETGLDHVSQQILSATCLVLQFLCLLVNFFIAVISDFLPAQASPLQQQVNQSTVLGRSSQTWQFLLVAGFSFPRHPSALKYTLAPVIMSPQCSPYTGCLFAFCHEDRMRRHLNPLPVTKATDHHCNQIPATFQCFLQQWDKVPVFLLSPTSSVVFALLNLKTTGTQCAARQRFVQCFVFFSTSQWKWDLQTQELCGSRSNMLLSDTDRNNYDSSSFFVKSLTR